MKNTSSAMLDIKNDIEEKLPMLLESRGVKDFEGYAIGYPVDPEKKLLCVRFASIDKGASEEAFEFEVHIQLPGTLETDAYLYIDAVNEYLDEHFDPCITNCVKGDYLVSMKDDPRTTKLEVFWSVKTTCQKDDCDF